MSKVIATLSGIVVLAAGFSSGCASIISGTKQTIAISSAPSGAKVRMGPYTGTTPYTVALPKGKDYPVEVTLDSQKRVIALQRSFDAIGIINILFWPGFIVDAVTGAITKYDPATYHVDFDTE